MTLVGYEAVNQFDVFDHSVPIVNMSANPEADCNPRSKILNTFKRSQSRKSRSESEMIRG
jgi:hypothetical protein